MTIDLTRPAEEVTTDAGSPYRPLLETLQGNILKSHGRNLERHMFLRFTGDAGAVRAWIRDKVAPKVLTAAKQFDDAARRHADQTFDGGMVTLFFLSAAGYRYLGFDPRGFESKIFRKGMKDEEDDILDDLLSKGNKDPKPEAWEQGYRGEIHAMIQLGDDADTSETRLLNGVSLVRSELQGIAEVVAEETGRALRRVVQNGGTTTEEPIEHFGYFDGISQPIFTRPIWMIITHRARGRPAARNGILRRASTSSSFPTPSPTPMTATEASSSTASFTRMSAPGTMP